MKPYRLQVKNKPSKTPRWLEVERFADRGEAVTAGKAYLAAVRDGKIARVVCKVVSVKVLWGGVAR